MLKDQFGRVHNYLRLSLTERCNLRCFYCMPPEGIQLSPKENLMNADEIISIAETFVSLGISKIRLTGGEPLVRKDFSEILKRLSALPVELALTTNGILLDQYIDELEKAGLKKINISIDSLKKDNFNQITRREYYDRVMRNLNALTERNFEPKLNCVVIKNTNEDEIADFIELTRNRSIGIQFIEFMPFRGNKWDNSLCVSMKEILLSAENAFGLQQIKRLKDSPNSTSKNFRIKGYKGSFGIISTVTNPFCDSCNRIRLTANGKIKNCLFSQTETDLLSAFRKGEDMKQLISESILNKKKSRGGIEDFSEEGSKILFENNRSMITIGG